MSPCRHGLFWNACKRQSGVGSECGYFVATATRCASTFHCVNWAALLGFFGFCSCDYVSMSFLQPAE